MSLYTEADDHSWAKAGLGAPMCAHTRTCDLSLYLFDTTVYALRDPPVCHPIQLARTSLDIPTLNYRIKDTCRLLTFSKILI